MRNNNNNSNSRKIELIYSETDTNFQIGRITVLQGKDATTEDFNQLWKMLKDFVEKGADEENKLDS